MTRRVLLRSLIAIGVVVAASVTSWMAAIRFQAPEQRAASAQFETSAKITAKVRVGDLSDSFTLDAVVGYSVESPVTATLGAGPSVVTAVNRPDGSTIGVGDWLLAVNDRPVFVLVGPFPMYRDLRFGDTGPDVEMIQAGLRAAGLRVDNSETGTFGRTTQLATAALYRRAGRPLPTPPAALNEEIAATEEALTAADTPQNAERLRNLERQAGPSAPRSEFAITPSLPAVVSGTKPVGATIEDGDSLAALLSGAQQIVATTTSTIAAKARVGDSVEIQASSATITGAVTAVDPGPATAAGTTEGTPPARILVVPSEPVALTPGDAVTITVQRKLVAQQALLVPATAITTRRGQTFVEVLDDQIWNEIDVQVLGQLAGVVAIAPVAPASLREGDRVLVGSG